MLEFDTTFRGRVKPAAAEEQGRVVGKYLDGLGREHDVMAGTVEVLLSYLRTYNRIGNAQVSGVRQRREGQGSGSGGAAVVP